MQVLTIVVVGSQPSYSTILSCFKSWQELCSLAKMLDCFEEEFDEGAEGDSVAMGDAEGSSDVTGAYMTEGDSSLSSIWTIAAACTILSRNAVESATNSVFMVLKALQKKNSKINFTKTI